jgi:hypothetical protein
VSTLDHGRQHRDAAAFFHVAMVGPGRALSPDVAQPRPDDHRVPAERAGSDAGSTRRHRRDSLRALGVRAALARPAARLRDPLGIR